MAKVVPKTALAAKELEQFKGALLRLRERLTGQISSLSDDSLRYVDDSSSEDRTDDFDREFALNLVSSEHDALFDIDEALRRIEERTYGACGSCGEAIEKGRLQALPFARMCVRCQSDSERGRSRFRPFGDTLSEGTEPSAEAAETEEVE
jgi:RNA polymerase-binding transcription factor DksA